MDYDGKIHKMNLHRHCSPRNAYYGSCEKRFDAAGAITRGKTVSDRDTDIKFGVKNTFVVLNVDRERFARILTAVLTRQPF